MRLFHSLKAQLALLIGVLVVVLLAGNAWVLIRSKTEELRTDIYRNAVSFANLTIGRVVTDYQTYFDKKEYTQFAMELSQIFKLNTDIYRLQIVAYPTRQDSQEYALIRYDTNTKETDIGSHIDRERISDPVTLSQLRLNYPTVQLLNQPTVYALTENGYVDLQGNKAAFFQGEQPIANVTFPYPDGTHAAIYFVSYNQLEARVQKTSWNILLLTIVAMISAVVIAFLIAKRVIDPIQQLTSRALQLAKGNFDQQIQIHSNNEVGVLARTFNTMTRELQEYQRNLVEKEKLHQELVMAAEIQQNLLPKVLPPIAGLDIAAGIKPAVAVGGDVYDFIPLQNKDVLFFIGDVTGHGVPASLIAAITNTLIFTLQASSPLPRDIALLANDVLFHKTKKDMFVTMIIAKWEEAAQQLRYTSAGHDQMLHYHAATGKATLEAKGGVALGLMPDIQRHLEDRTVHLQSGDFILLYSDGIPEAVNNDGKRFSMDRFLHLAETCGHFATAQEIYNTILRETMTYMGNHPQADDITLIVLKKN